MKIEIDKKIGTLALIYEHLNGGYYSPCCELISYYSQQAHQLVLNKNKAKLLDLYNELKKDVPNYIVSSIEKSAGIRYFCCDDCHDAFIKNASYIRCFLCI